MELWLTVQTDGGTRTELAVDIAAETTVGELTSVLTTALGLDGTAISVGLPRLGAVLDPRDGVLATGLRYGDRVTMTARPLRTVQPRRGRTGVTRYTASVVGGPGTGTRVPLGDGEYSVGRAADADISIDDSALSRRHARIVVNRDTVTVSDNGSSNGTFIDARRLTEPIAVAPGTIVEIGHTLFEIDVFVPGRPDAPPNQSGFVRFNRPPRVASPPRGGALRLAAPPNTPSKSRLPLSSAIGPLLLGAPLVVLGSGAMRTIGIVSMLLSPLLAIMSFLEDRRSGRRDHRTAVAEWRAALADLDGTLDNAIKHEAVERRNQNPDAAELLERAATARPGLWERRPADADFLQVAVGWSDQRSYATVTIADGGDPALRAEADQVIAARQLVTNVPVAAQLRDLGTIGLAGSPSVVTSLHRWIAAQIVTLHSPREAAVVAIVAPEEVAEWHWLTWVPHLRGDTNPVDGVRFATTTDQAAELIGSLKNLVRVDDTVFGRTETTSSTPTIVLLVSRNAPVARNAVAELLAGTTGRRLVVVWQDDAVDALPGAATCIVAVHSEPPVADVTWTATGDRLASCLVDQLSLDAAETLAVDLAPIRDVTAGGARGQIPRTATLPDTVAVEFPLGDWLAQKWRVPSPELDAVVGASAAGPFTIDIRHDGPHALVGGTTGAGKSELLQTLISGLVINHPPTKVTFLLVDYKGGAAFKDAVLLPHTVGLVTDLDGHLVQRALVSLHAELRRREHLLRDHGVRDLIEMERRFPELAPPSLLLVVDEFATLAKELPEFVDGVVSVAQRGRSLGIHLVLATQRPAGAINDNIRANTNLRIALRMNDIADSNDVIDSPDAAALPRTLPGRAYVKTGQSELTEVQITYVGGHALDAGKNAHAAVSTSVVAIVGRDAPKPHASAADAPTDLQLLVAAANQAVDALGLSPQPAPWVPPLPTCAPLAMVIELADAADAGARGGVSAVIGIIDLPDQQRHAVHTIDLDEVGSIAVYGASGSGKTTVLRTLAASLAMRNPVADVQVYVIDAAGRSLEPLADLPHVGDVLAADAVDRVQRLIRTAEQEIQTRQRLFAEAGVSNLIEFRRRGDATLPHVVVLLDGYAAFAAIYERIDHGVWLDRLTALVADGRSAGIHLVITADRRATVPTSLASAMSDLIALRLSDDDHGSLGIDAAATKGVHFVPGRGFTAASRELQVAVVGDDGAGEAQLRALAQLASTLDHSSQPPRIGKLPDTVDRETLPHLAGRIVVGIGDRTLEPVSIDPLDGGFLVAGPNRSGRSNALHVLALDAAPLALGGLHLFAPRRSPLTELDLWTHVARGHAQCEEYAEELCDQLLDRSLDDELVAIFIDDAGELSDSDAEAPLEKLARRARDLNIWFCLGAEASQVRRSFGGPLAEVRRDRHGLLLRPDVDLDGDLLDTQVPRLAPTAWVLGRGVLVANSQSDLVQVAIVRPPSQNVIQSASPAAH